VPNKQEIVHAEIPGDGSTTQEVAIGGHLFESYIKQGANDDNSGCALTLEIGRAYIKLIAEGKLPRPKRTINFQWVREISGTNAWFNAHPDKQKVIIGDLNFDMEALRLTQSRSYWVLQRTPAVAALMDGYKEARVAILHQAEIEKGVVNSASILWRTSTTARKRRPLLRR